MNITIYKLYDKNNPNLVYVGSTKNTLNWRLRKHFEQIDHPHKITSRIIIQKANSLDDIIIEPLEVTEENNRLYRESYWYNRLNCVNRCDPKPRTQEDILNYIREWRKSNPDVRAKFVNCVKCDRIMSRRIIYEHMRKCELKEYLWK